MGRLISHWRTSGLRVAVDTGGTFTDLVVEEDGTLRLFKSPTTPHDPVRGVLDVLTVAADSLASDLAELLGRVELFVHGTTRATNAVLTGHDRQDRVPHHRRPSRHPAVPRGRPRAAVRLHAPLPRPVRPARADVRGARARRVRPARSSPPLDEAMPSSDPPAGRAATSRRWRSACCGRSSTRRTSCASASCSSSICPAFRTRCRTRSTRSLREYRRASSAAIDASLKPLMTALPGSARAAPARRRLRRAAARGHRERRGARRGDDGRGADPLDQLRSVDGAGRGPPLRASATRARPPRSSPTPAARATTSSLVRHGRIPWTRETWLGRPYDGHHHRVPVGRRQEHRRRRRQHRLGRRRRPAPRRAGAAPAPIRARPATGGAACTRRSPTRRSCSATSIPATSSAARLRSTCDAARQAIERDVGDAA